MAKRDSWVALVTEPASEYTAKTELERLGLSPYMPQFKSMWRPQGSPRPLVRRQPLFPRYLFLPLDQARVREVHFVRGLKRPKPILADADGNLWLVPDDIIFEISDCENRGVFDDAILPGSKVQVRTSKVLREVEIFLQSTTERTANLLLPLFGGCRGSTARVDIARV